MEQNNREKANKMVWSPDEVRREHARTKSVKSSIDAVQKTARETQAYMDRNDEEATTNNKFDMGGSKSPGKGSRKMEGYFETIGGRGDGICGVCCRVFFLVFSPVCPKEFFLLFLLFFNFFSFLFCSVSLDFSSFLLNAWFELLGTLVVDSHGGITIATLRDVNL